MELLETSVEPLNTILNADVALPLNRLCLNLCGGGAAFLPSTVLARLGRTWRV